ncbi:MAG: signal recognition particle protein [Bdellovibrionota bacterium]
MLDILSDGFKTASDKLKGKTKLTDENVSSALAEIRRSLLEADVEYSVSKNFLQKVKEKALGETVSLKAGTGQNKMKVSPGDHFVNICKEELENLMGPVETSIAMPKGGPATIMMVGLQGTGKTTTTGKLAKYLMRKLNKKPLLVAADIYRPAAAEQLKVLGQKIGAPVFHIANTSPVIICEEAKKQAIELNCDTILFDTAGRVTIDDALMDELEQIKEKTKPDNIFLVCDAMMGQDAVTTAKAFNDRLALSGFIMTKLDGDARGGAALSIKEITGKPIKFLGMGEDLDKLEEFRPEGLASRILGMGDIVGLMEDFDRISEGDKEEDALRMLQGQFTFNDFYEQISMLQKMGGIKDVLTKLPMQGMIPKDANIDDKELLRTKSMIDSMTKLERIKPDVINESRARRIAKGSGHNLKDIGELVKKFKSMRSMMGNIGKSMGLLGKIPGMKGLGQLNQMRKMASQMQNGGMPDLSSMMGGLGGGLPGMMPGATPTLKKVDREKLAKKRKEARKNRKKNRRK